jgi:hypothetical protein
MPIPSAISAFLDNPGAAAAIFGLPPVHAVEPALLIDAVRVHAAEIGEAFDASGTGLDAESMALFFQQTISAHRHLMGAFIMASGRKDFAEVASLDDGRLLILAALVLAASMGTLRNSASLPVDIVSELAPHSNRLSLMLSAPAGPLQ